MPFSVKVWGPMTPYRLALTALFLSATASAQNLRVIPVPWAATNPSVPHHAFNGHATTFKAIARGRERHLRRGLGLQRRRHLRLHRHGHKSVRFLSSRFTFPNQSAPATFLARVRVTSNGQSVVGTYPVRVFPEVPTDPNVATDRQLQIMRNVAIDDALWFLHNQLVRTGNEEDPFSGAQVSANISTGGPDNIAVGAALEALGRNRRFPAFPTAYLGQMPDPVANAARWATDPYAEDALRLINRLLTQTTVISVVATDENNLIGFYPETNAVPIPGSDDGIGLLVGYSPGDTTLGPGAKTHSAGWRSRTWPVMFVNLAF